MGLGTEVVEGRVLESWTCWSHILEGTWGGQQCPQVSWVEEVAVAHPLLEPLGDDLGAALAAWKAAVNHRQAEKQSFLYKT